LDLSREKYPVVASAITPSTIMVPPFPAAVFAAEKDSFDAPRVRPLLTSAPSDDKYMVAMS
jgi:hypothetical protein